MHDTSDEADETLSLSDLPLYGDQSVEEWEEDLSNESQGSSSISSSENDYFEFFSQELCPSTTSFPPESFVFCGKLIPYKKPDTSDIVPSNVIQSKKPTNVKKKPGWSIFRWKFSLKYGKKSTTTLMHNKDHHDQSSKKKYDHHDQSSKKKYKSNKQGKGSGFRLHKMSIFTPTSSTKARWHLFLFGISKFSSQMDLRDIKNRQSRRQSPPPSPMIRISDHHDDQQVKGETSRGSGLWGLIKVLSCGKNHHPSGMVVGSIGTNRLE